MLGLWMVWQLNQWLKFFTLFPRHIPCESKILANDLSRFAGFNNSLGGLVDAVVPDVLHFVRMGKGQDVVSPEEAACISAALRTQPGASVVVHTDRAALRGEAWERLVRQSGRRLRVVRRPRPLHVFGLPIRDDDTLHRVVALRTITKYGGVYLSSSAYLQSDLTPLRHFECALASSASSTSSWPDVLVSHRDARLPHRWLKHFHDAHLVWERRPTESPDLCRRDPGVNVVVTLAWVPDPSVAEAGVHPEDWYLWGQTRSRTESSNKSTRGALSRQGSEAN